MKLLYILLALVLPAGVMAQEQKESKEAEQIIITKKGASGDKLNIVVDGDNVMVNGQPVSTDKDADITVKRRKIKDLEVFNDERPLRSRSFGYGDSFGSMAPNKAMLGVATQKNDQGVQVMSVSEESAAEKAGIKEGDIIIEVDREKITTPDALSNIIKEKKPGDKVTVVYIRDKKQHTTVATLTKWDGPQVFGFDSGGSGSAPNIDIEDLMRSMPNQGGRGNQRYFFSMPQSDNDARLGMRVQDNDKGDGLKILSVEDGSAAEKAGLEEGDVITAVDGKKLTGSDQVQDIIAAARSKSGIKLEILRDGKKKNIEIPYTRKLKTTDL